MPIFKSKRKRDKGYSVKDGEFKIEPKNDYKSAFEASAKQANEKLSALQKTGLTNTDDAQKQKQWEKITDQTGETYKMKQQEDAAAADPNAKFQSPLTWPSHKDKEFKKNKEGVTELQTFLQGEGFKIDADGAWGPATEKAYKDYKSKKSRELPKENAASVKENVKGLDNVLIKGNELDNGGGITPLLAERTNTIMSDLNEHMIGNNKIRITAGNDKWHQDRYEKNGRYSIHQEGNSLDFTPFKYGIKVKGKGKRDLTAEEWKQVDAMEARLKELQKKNPGEFTFINEYRTPNGPYGHFHIEAKDPKTQRALGDTHH